MPSNGTVSEGMVSEGISYTAANDARAARPEPIASLLGWARLSAIALALVHHPWHFRPMAKATKRSLAEVLAEHQETAPPDRRRARDQYLKRVAELYALIRGWLEPSIAKRLARVTSGGAVTLGDEGVEPYDAPVLFVDVGRRRIQFLPAGFSVIGADGRIDLEAGKRIAMLVHRRGAWHFARREPKLQLIVLDESSFTEAIAELLGE